MAHDPNGYGSLPSYLGQFEFDLSEVMYYLYLPIRMDGCDDIRLPPNVEICRPLINRCRVSATRHTAALHYRYIYLSARKGYATPDNPLNRPGWHCDSFGTDDMNYVWWVGPGTRFANQTFADISPDHLVSLRQFEEQVDLACVKSYPERGLFGISPRVVHATPLIEPPGCMRQYVKVSMSNHRYNLENNSHNYLFNYSWPLHSRDEIRNDPIAAQGDYKA